MSQPTNNLYALAFDDEYKADEARVLFKRMAGEGLLVLDQTAVVVVGIDGKPRITQDVDLTSTRRNQGHWIGIAAAWVTGVIPLIMAATVAGHLVGQVMDRGITKRTMKPIADALTPGTSALFGLGRVEHEENRERIIERVRHLHPKIVHTTVSSELLAHVEELLEQPPQVASS